MSDDPTESLPDRARLETGFERRRPAYASVLEDMERLVRDSLEAAGMTVSVGGRIKSFESYYRKRVRILRAAHAEGKPAIPLTDIIGLRVVCPFLGDLARAERVIGEAFRVIETERKGAERSFREFGYESIHLLVELPDELREARPGLDLSVCEIQLRTILQEAWAEVEHELVYKAEFTPFDEPMKRKLAALNANLTLSDIIFQEIRDYQKRLSHELEKRRASFYSKIEESMDSAIEGLRQVPPGASVPVPEGLPAESPDWSEASLDDMLLEALNAHNRRALGYAILLYTAILERNPPREAAAVIHKHRGMAYFSESRYAEAIADFDRVLELDPQCYRAAYFRGVVHSVLGEPRAALADFDLSLSINPYQFFSLYRRAQAWWHLGDPAAVLRDCEAALRIEPGHAQALELKALALRELES